MHMITSRHTKLHPLYWTNIDPLYPLVALLVPGPLLEAGIVGKKGLLFSPAIYPLSMPITVTTPGFVILGLGFATLVSLEAKQK